MLPGEPCESCQMTVTSDPDVALYGVKVPGMFEVLMVGRGAVDIIRHTVERCRAASTLRRIVTDALPGDTVTIRGVIGTEQLKVAVSRPVKGVVYGHGQVVSLSTLEHSIVPYEDHCAWAAGRMRRELDAAVAGASA